MDMQVFVTFLLMALAAGALAYVFIDPLISGEARAQKRQKHVAGIAARATRESRSLTSRKDQVAQTLREIESRTHKKVFTLEDKISQAGLDWDKQKFFFVSSVCGAILAGLVFVLIGQIWLALIFGFIGAFGIPLWGLSFLRKARVAKFSEELPNSMDVIVRGIKAGLPLADCLRIIANESQDPVRSEFRRIIDAQAIGISIAESCTKMYDRVPVPEAHFFSIVINIQQKTGGNLCEALGNLSKVLRERKKMRAKIIAMSMEAKASAAIIAAMPLVVSVMTFFSSPDYIGLLWQTQAGLMGLALGGLLMGTGVLMMRKMINFEI
jgi:tight adherence protein B